MVRKDDLERFQAQKEEAGLSEQGDKLKEEVTSLISEIKLYLSSFSVSKPLEFKKTGELFSPGKLGSIPHEYWRDINRLIGELKAIVGRGGKIPEEFLAKDDELKARVNQDLEEL